MQEAVKIMAKDVVRTRRYVRKFILMRAQIQAVSLKIQVRECARVHLRRPSAAHLPATDGARHSNRHCDRTKLWRMR